MTARTFGAIAPWVLAPAAGLLLAPGPAQTTLASAVTTPAEVSAATAMTAAPPATTPTATTADPGQADDNFPYSAKFALARIRFDVPMQFGLGGNGPPWAHDFPRAETNLMRIVEATTSINLYQGGGNIFTLDDPELFRYPVAYLVEPGFWRPTDVEVSRLREYLLKGGFMIVDDFRGDHIYNFDAQMRRILPDFKFEVLDTSDPIFDSFFGIESLDFEAPYGGLDPVYLGIYENGDTSQRLMAIVNYNNDIGDYWEWSDAGIIPIDLSNEAFKLGVNYLVYGLTH
ncbi:MAG: DUF4159 domain-containing protein [Gemmatimonadota bacterium]